MKRTSIAVVTLLVAAAAFPQPPAAQQPISDSEKIVAVINGETLTKEKLDALYAGIGAQMRAQYEKNGGRSAFLDNYVGKRLLVQEALKADFDKRADVKTAIEAAREAVLFDRYVRDVIAADVVTDGDVRKYYDEHSTDFNSPEQVKVRHIVVTFQGKEKEQALNKIKPVVGEIVSSGVSSPALLLRHFEDAARKYSEDGTAQSGGDLGWVPRGNLDPAFEDVAFRLKPGIMSGIVETPYGYHLILVEDKRPETKQPFESVKADIREFLISQRMADVMTALKKLTNELRRSSKVAIYNENLN